MVDGVINNFKIGRKTKSSNQMIVLVNGVDSKDAAEKLVGKKAIYTTESGKAISGEIKSSHGSNGAIRVAFEKGMPGQAIGKKIKIEG